jgi:hypothetical protein
MSLASDSERPRIFAIYRFEKNLPTRDRVSPENQKAKPNTSHPTLTTFPGSESGGRSNSVLDRISMSAFLGYLGAAFQRGAGIRARMKTKTVPLYHRQPSAWMQLVPTIIGSYWDPLYIQYIN